MKGHEELIDLRRRRKVPADGVVIECTAKRGAASSSEAAGSLARLTIGPDETLGRLDLRCLVGMEVIVIGYEFGHRQRVLDVSASCVTAGAKVVMAWCLKGEYGPEDSPERQPTIFTHGVDAWQP